MVIKNQVGYTILLYQWFWTVRRIEKMPEKKYLDLRASAFALKQKLNIKFSYALNIIAKEQGFTSWRDLMSHKKE